MADLSAEYDAIFGEISAMMGQLDQATALSQELRSVINGMPENAIDGGAMMSFVTYLLGVQQRLDQVIAHYKALIQAARQAVQTLQDADTQLQAAAPQW